MKFINYTVIYFAVLVALGILTAHFTPTFFFSLPFLAVLTIAIITSWFIARKQLFPTLFFGSLAFIAFFGIGFANYQLRLPTYQKLHYSHTTSENKAAVLQLKVLEALKPDNYYIKFIATVQASEGTNTTGKVLLQIHKDSLIPSITVDDILLVSASLQNIPKPLNPHQFEYANYMKNLGVYHRVLISNDYILQHSKGSKTLRGHAESLRNYCLKKLLQTDITTDERAITQALVLGQKKDISKQLYAQYAAAGAVHILAVSGLHVGIIYLIFSFLLRPLTHLPHGEIVHSALVILLLWCFAFITGLSPSVTRAVTMFSFFAFATALRRDTNSINTLFLSFLVLLLINPLWLFQVGFQMSYMAVAAILWIQPTLYSYYRPRFYIDRLFWGIFTVSIAAQLGVFPLSLHYFHQFPGLFFVTNLVVLPFLGLILSAGLLIVVLAAFSVLPEKLVLFYNFGIEYLNNFIAWVATKDHFIIEDISFSEAKVLASYLIIISVFLLWKKLSYRRTVLVLCSFSLFMGVLIWENYTASETRLIVFHKSRTSLIGYKQARALKIFRSNLDTATTFQKTNPIKQYRIGEAITVFSEAPLQKIFRYREKTILVLDSLGVYPTISEGSIVLLTESPKVHLERLIDSLKPACIIADGSNYRSYVQRWEKTCAQKKLPFYHTGSKGALIIE